MKTFAFASVAAFALLSLAACNDTDKTTTGSTTGGSTAGESTSAGSTSANSTAAAAQPATTSGASGAAPATTTAPASGATTNSGNVLPTTDNTSSQTIETRPDVPQSGSGGASQSNPAPDDATPTAPTAQPGGSTTTAQ